MFCFPEKLQNAFCLAHSIIPWEVSEEYTYLLSLWFVYILIPNNSPSKLLYFFDKLFDCV